jgi:UDPglucose 6-dehydrogenase
MKVTVIGLGYVGLTYALYLSKQHTVYAYDIDDEKIERLGQGIVDLREPGLSLLLKSNKKNLFFSNHLESMVAKSDVTLIAVPTPEGDDGNPDLSALQAVLHQCIAYSKPHQIIIIKSTVLPGTYHRLLTYLRQANRPDLTLVSMPEFLSLGSALKNVTHPDRVVVGTTESNGLPLLKKLLHYPTSIPWVVTTPQTAELIKYASNSYLANRLSFINEMSQVAEVTGADIEEVVNGMGLDPRIGTSFINPGVGFGGSCFPKDLKALYQFAKQSGLKARMLEATITTNHEQIERFTQRIIKRFSNQFKDKKIAILGLAYKGSTSDVRHSPAFQVVEALTGKEAILIGYDRYATMNFFQICGEKPCMGYTTTLEDALSQADCAIILNDAPEIKKLRAKQFVRWMKQPLVFDGRNLFDPKRMIGVEYHSIGRLSS